MEPERCTRMIGAMAAVLAAGGIAFDDPAFYFASFSLVLFIAALAVRFRLRMHHIVSSANLERSANKKAVAQGSTVVILTTFTCSPVRGTAASIRELLPPGAGDDSAAHIMPVAPDGTATLLYHITPLVPGKLSVGGIVLTVTDPFFTADLMLLSPPFSGPEIDVHPQATYERLRPRTETGTRERNRPSIERGTNIRTFREYLPGDDIRSVDWKMTAKYQRMFIREYTSVENLPPLVVLDIPSADMPVTDEELATLVNGANRATATATHAHGSVSLLIISGINVITILIGEKNPQRCTAAILDAAHPQARLHHAYRWKNRTALRMLARTCKRAVPREEGAVRHFHARVASVCGRSLASPTVPVFAIQFGSLLRSLQLHEIFIYSLFAGDLSHLKEIAFQAQEKQIRIVPRTVARGDAPAGMRSARLEGAGPVEVIA